MNKNIIRSFFVVLFVCLVKTASAYDEVDLSAMEDKTLNEEEVKTAVSGRILHGVNSRGQKVEYYFKEGGYLMGNSESRSDSGRWTVTNGILCMTWSRWTDSCYPVTVENRKLRTGSFKQD